MNKTVINNRSGSREELLFIAAFFFAFAALAFLFPVTGDDYGWGSGFGEKLFSEGFRNYNGRYLGNLLVLFLTRARYFSHFFVSFVITAIVYLIYKLSDSANIESLYMTGVLMLLVSTMFRQVYSWVSGFANYVPPVLLLLLFFYMAKKCFKQPDLRATGYSYIFAVLIGVSMQLFMEHITIYSLAASLFFVIAWRFRHKKYNPLLLTFFFSCLTGAIIMFTNGAYLKILNMGDSYRSVIPNDGGLTGIVRRMAGIFLGTICEIMYKGCYASVAAICVLSIILILKSPNIRKRLLLGILLITGFVFACSWLPVYLGIKAFTSITRKQMLFIFPYAVIIFIVSLLVLILTFIKISEIKKRLFFFFISGVVSLCLLLCVKPIGPRCFYLLNIFLILSANEIFLQIVGTIGDERFLLLRIKKAVRYTSIALCVITFAVLFLVYGRITKVYNQRMEYIIAQAQKGEKVIYAPRLPLQQFVWDADPPSENQKRFSRFCDYFDLPEDIKIIYIRYGDWLELREGK